MSVYSAVAVKCWYIEAVMRTSVVVVTLLGMCLCGSINAKRSELVCDNNVVYI